MRTRLFLLVFFALAAPAAADVPLTESPAAARDSTRAPKPSGFWGSGAPAKGGAYRYRMMAVGAGVLAVAGLLTFRLLRRSGRERGTPTS